MNWGKAAIDDLTRYKGQKESLTNIKQRIWALNQQLDGIRAVSTDRTPVQGGCSHMEDAMLNNIVERERLTYTYRATERLVRLIERGLAGLDDKERRALDMFFIRRNQGHVEKLMEEWHLEKSQVYHIKDDALYRFTICMYGLTDY